MSEPQANTSGNVGTEPVLDESALDEFTGGDAGLRREILQQFLEANAADMDALRLALKGTDIALIGRAAHRVKGSSLMIGAKAFASVLQAMEKAAREDRRDAVDGCVATLEQEHARLTDVLRKATQGN